MNVTIKQLRAFVAIAEATSFTRAAERLSVTQSALSVLIRELEYDVGIKLLERTTRAVALTAAGCEFLKPATRMLADLECAVRDARSVVQRQQGQVTIGVPPLAAATFIAQIIAKLRLSHPEISVAVRDMRPDEIAAAAANGEIRQGLLAHLRGRREARGRKAQAAERSRPRSRSWRRPGRCAVR